MAQRRFSAAQRVDILRMVPNKPTGVLFEFGGMEFDLISVPTGKLIETLDTLDQLANLTKSGNESDMLSAIGNRGGKLLATARDVLKKSAFYGVDAPAEDVAVFDEWFDALPPLALLRAIVKPLFEAAGVSGVAKDPSTPTTETETPAPANSIP